jgi:hypothetical protein
MVVGACLMEEVSCDNHKVGFKFNRLIHEFTEGVVKVLPARF